jgi:hypothetical protein
VIEEAIFTLVTGNAAVKALIGLRLYPSVIPEKTKLPAAAYQVISVGREYHHGGQSSIARPVIGFTFDSRSITEAREVAAAVRQLLSGYHGEVGTVYIGYISLQNEFEGYNPASEVYLVRQDYQIVWKEV